MWIFTPIGFFSVVKKEHNEPGEITIRARVEGDLESLKGYIPSMSDIYESEYSDYRYRATAKHSDYADALAKLSMEIDYSNFKNKVTESQGRRRARIYGDVWSTVYELQAGLSDWQRFEIDDE